MAKAVFIQNPTSIYKDEPGVRYHFPKMYLSTVESTVGDWVIFYEGKRGVLGYTSVQKVLAVRPDPDLPDHFFAEMDLGTLWQFEHPVPRIDEGGRAYETLLRAADGRPIRGGANVLAVRRLDDADFVRIAERGMQPVNGPEALPRDEVIAQSEIGGFAEAQVPFGDAPLAPFREDLLVSRKARDESFARMVKTAYAGRCAISGLTLRNGGGRAEVQAAHIRPVHHGGPDTVANGLALSGTLHWMFDRGLISVAEDHSILIAHNKVSKETVDRLIIPDGKLILPDNPRDHPHPAYLRFHREEIYGNTTY